MAGPPKAQGYRVPGLFLTSSCSAFFDYWGTLRSANAVPHTSAFLDHAPTDLIPYAFIHDVEAGGLQVRFMGTGLVQRWRHDLTGLRFGDHLDEAARENLRLTMAIVAETPCGMHQIGRIESSTGRSLSFEAIALPLAVDADRLPRVTVFSQILDSMERDEHSRQFRAAGDKAWLDLGWGTPATPPPT